MQLEDLWRLDLETMQWRQLHPSGTTPPARCSTVAAVVDQAGTRVLYVGGAFYGTSGGLEMLGDVQVLDLGQGTGDGQWVEVASGGSTPSARNAAAAAMLPNSDGSGSKRRLLMHGGWKAFVETYNSTYLVDVE